MSDKKQPLWLTDGYGNKAVVDPGERDRWSPRGWVPCPEPGVGDRVWLRHEGHGGRQLFPAPAVELWAGLGWAPSDPPEPVDVTKDPALVDVPPDEQSSRPKAASKSKAASGEKE